MSWKATWGKTCLAMFRGQYCTPNCGGDILFPIQYHINKIEKDTLLVSAYYDRLGTKDSMEVHSFNNNRCIMDFNNCPSGTQVEFYSKF